MNQNFLRVAVPIRVYGTFDYKCSDSMIVPVGSRVVVPFGPRTIVGIVVQHVETPAVALEKLVSIISVVDKEPVFTDDLLKTLRWVSNYYHQPFGEILWSALPQKLRGKRQQQPNFGDVTAYQVTEKGKKADLSSMARAPVQKAIMNLLKTKGQPVPKEVIQSEIGRSWRGALKSLEAKEWITSGTFAKQRNLVSSRSFHTLTNDQQNARDQILSHLRRYQSFLIHGVTGSGKTEVYLHVMVEILKTDGQVLMLVPEIGLTPQLKQHLESSLGVPVSSYHSGLTPNQLHRTWWDAKTGEAKVVIGTRSAVFLPFRRLAMIVMDEEHDNSFKQQERASYHARSVAIHRAAANKIPLIFGTATPSLEMVFAVQNNRVQKLNLPKRVTNAKMPAVKLIDLNNAMTIDGIAISLLREVKERINRNEQSLIFINRRGYAPVVLCIDCKWVAKCENCDANLIFHAADQRLHCHHCLQRVSMIRSCPQCTSERIQLLSVGTQRIEQALRNHIPGARILRIDRDTTRSYQEFERKLDKIHDGKADILIGTQMLSKGHHFPNVTLVGVLNVDQGFYSIDFRALESMVQQVLQVAGRAGRAEKPGEVFIQTFYPEGEVFSSIRQHDYMAFAEMELENRMEAEQPPFSHYSLLRANSQKEGKEIEFLAQAHACGVRLLKSNRFEAVQLFDIVQSPIQKISNRHRAQLLCGSNIPSMLRQFLNEWMIQIEHIPKKGNLRWRLDVDPISFI